MTSSINVNVCVESISENAVQEVYYDGQEVYQAPYSLSENLSTLIRKIDFSKIPCSSIKQSSRSETTKDVQSESSASDVTWTSIISDLRNAATEVCVLLDVINISKEKHFLVLDPVPQEQYDPKPITQVYSRKKGLMLASSMLLSAAERLRACHSDTSRNKVIPDFHTELLRLRHSWRLKKLSDNIIGDLSYKTAGSKFYQSGVFEVTQADENEDLPPHSILSPSSLAPRKPLSVLKVDIPTELQGNSYIMVRLQKGNERVFDARFDSFGSVPNTPNVDVHWQQKLEAAQNVLFCKELYSQLAREAVQLQNYVPHFVVGKEIVATIAPGIRLIIALYHNTETERSFGNGNSSNSELTPGSNHDRVLEHSLHQLLREAHRKNVYLPFPHPSSGPLGPSKKRYVAGPSAADRATLVDMIKSSTILEQIINQAYAFCMKMQTEQVLDTFAHDLKDPLIISHWNSLRDPNPTCVRVNIVSNGYDTMSRTSLLLQLLSDRIKCINKDGRVMYITYEPEQLTNLIFLQVQNHYITGTQNIGRSMGWHVVHSGLMLGSGPVQPYGNASFCVMCSPFHDRVIAIKCEPCAKVIVSMAQSPRKDFFCGQLIKERKWENLGSPFKEVRTAKMEGKTLFNKIEMLLASLSTSAL